MNALQAIGTGLKGISTVTSFLSDSTSSTSSSAKTLGGVPQGKFLELLISQITHQNPLEPMDNTTMLTQMSQFETMDKLDKLNEKMSTMTMYQNLLNSVNLVGKNVKIVLPDSGTEVTGPVEAIRMEGGLPGLVVGGKFYDVTKVEIIKN